MSTVNTGEISLEYYVEGSGPPLLMIMGMGGQARSWGEPFLELLRAHFQIIRFSNRGTGLSDKPGGDLTIRMMADDAAALLDKLGLTEAHVLGISMGGMIAQELVLNHPQKVKGLVLGCTFCGQAHSVPPSTDTVVRLAQMNTLPVNERIGQYWLVCVTPGFIENNHAFLDEIIAIHLDSPTPWETFGRQFVAAQSFDTYNRLPQITAPTLVIHGDRDVLIPAGNANVLSDRIPGAKMSIVPDVGHCFFWEKPRESAEPIVEFLKTAIPA